MTTQDIIAEHTRRISLAVQNAERERMALIIKSDIAKQSELGMTASVKYLEQLVERINGDK